MAELFRLVYSPGVRDHLAAIDRKHWPLIRRTVQEQLAYEPDLETRNRKPLLRPSVFGSAWELRFGPDNRFRVFYKTDFSNREVRILAIGFKSGSRLRIGGEEFDL